MVDMFNKYSKENNLDIDVDLIFFGRTNLSSSITEYENTLESIFSKKNDKYDLIIMYELNVKEFGDHLLELDDYIPEEYKNYYSKGKSYKTCFNDDGKWISLVNIFIYIFIYLET